MTSLLGGADEVMEGIDIDVPDALRVTVLKGRLEMSADASLGETVVVLANELAMPELYEPEPYDEDPLWLLLLPPLLRTRLEITSTWTSMKVSSGPATIALLCRSMASPFKG